MSLAERIEPTLAARRANTARRDAERAARDAFIVAQFALLQTRMDGLLRDAAGLHSALALSVAPQLLPVRGRSFASLAITVWTLRATFNGTPQTLSLTPALDFRAADQFGRIAFALDFDYAALRSRGDRIARALLDGGVQLRGTRTGHLMLPLPGSAGGAVELAAADLEAAFAAWWLR